VYGGTHNVVACHASLVLWYRYAVEAITSDKHVSHVGHSVVATMHRTLSHACPCNYRFEAGKETSGVPAWIAFLYLVQNNSFHFPEDPRLELLCKSPIIFPE